jgi:O-antigen ligase
MKLHQKFFWLLIFSLPFQIGRHFWPKFSFVLGLKIDYLSPTLYLTDLLLLLVLFFWLWETREKAKSFNLSWLKKNWWVGIFFLFFCLNVFLAQNQGVAFYKLVKITELFLLAFYVAKNSLSLRSLAFPLSLGVLVSSIIALFQFFHQGSLNGLFWWLGERTFDMNTPGIAKAIFNGQLILRPYATFSHPNALAGFLLVALILTSDFFLKKTRWLTYGYYFLGFSVLILSFSRSVWGVSLFVISWFLLRKKNQQKFWFLLILALTFLIFASFSSFSTNEAFSQRVQLMKSAWLMIQNFPLSGVGLNNFVVRLPDYWSLIGFTYWLQPVHNLFLLVIAETGFPGLLIFLWFLFLTYHRAFQLKDENRLLLVALSVVLLLGLTDHYWLTLQQNQLLFSLLIGLIWSSQN